MHLDLKWWLVREEGSLEGILGGEGLGCSGYTTLLTCCYLLLGVGSQVAEGRVTDQSPSSLSALWLCTLDEEAT